MAIAPSTAPIKMPALAPSVRPRLPACVAAGGIEVAEVAVDDEVVGEGVETAAPMTAATCVPWP